MGESREVLEDLGLLRMENELGGALQLELPGG